jgi:hypothetical protein
LHGLIKLPQLQKTDNPVRSEIHGKKYRASAGTGSALQTAHEVRFGVLLQILPDSLGLLTQYNGLGLLVRHSLLP